mgnify:FL=1
MNRDTCEHFTPISLRCAECEITTLQSELDAAREEIARAREALIDIWARHPNFPLNGKTPREQAEAHYAREIAAAHKGEEG